MAVWSVRPKIPRDIMDRMQIAIAVAAEAVMDEHVRAATELVRHGSDRAPVERLLAVYARLHRVADTTMYSVVERTLAGLGEDPDQSVGAAGLDAPRSLVRRTRLRLRGRVNPDLREWVEGHTARVELRIQDTLVRLARSFVSIGEGSLTPRQALDLYAEMLELDPVTATMVRLRVLDALYPEPAVAGPERPEVPRTPLRLATETG
jgi:hypothetical protein